MTFAFRTTHLPASRVIEKATLAYVVPLGVVVGLLLPQGSQLQCCIMNMPVLDVKSEKMLSNSIFVEERMSELDRSLLSRD